MNVNNNFSVSLSYDVLDIICGFLKVAQINQLAQTCNQFYKNFFIHAVSEEFNHVISAKSNANVLYCSSILKMSRIFNDNISNLKLIRFNISTKDQGWVSDCQSGSWIQAQFLPNNKDGVTNQPVQVSRSGLVYNYEVPDYAKKQKILHESSIPKGKDLLNIYLRTQGSGWEIACKKIQIVYFYSNRQSLNERQLRRERVVLRKKQKRATTR